MLLEGLHIPLTTPFHPDGRLNTHKLATNVARYSKTPAAGLILLCPTGEPTLLSDEETRTTLRIAAQAAAPDKVLLAGIARNSVFATLDLAEYAATLSYDAILVGTPSLLALAGPLDPGRIREALLYFQTIGDRSPLPIVLLSTPSNPIPAAIIAILATHPHVIGLYSTIAPAGVAEMLPQTTLIKREVTVTPIFNAVTKRMIQASDAAARRATLISVSSLSSPAAAVVDPPALASIAPLRTRTRTVGFQILAGASAGLLDALQAGASAVAPGFAACAPQACYEVYAAWKDADLPLAAEKQDRLTLAAKYAGSLGTGGLKFGCDLNGYFGGFPRLPLLPPTATERIELENLMEGMRN